MESIENIDLYHNIFDNPERLLISGSSNSGKTHLLENLIRKYHHRFYRIIVSGPKNRLFEFEETKKKTELYSTDGSNLYNPLLDIDSFDVKKHGDLQCLAIYDDMMSECHSSDVISNVFSKGRHLNISICLLMQSYTPQSSSKKSVYPQIKNNSTIQIFTKMRSQGEINLIARRLEYDKPSQMFFSNIIREQVQKVMYGYIAVFLEENDERARYRNNLLNEDGTQFESVYCM